jgi:hypothetical protein
MVLYCHDVSNGDTTADDLSVLIRCQEHHDTAVRPHSRYLPDQYGIGFAVDARADGLQARLRAVEVWSWDDAWLPGFRAHLAADYRGWTGERTWETDHPRWPGCPQGSGSVSPVSATGRLPRTPLRPDRDAQRAGAAPPRPDHVPCAA